MSKVVIVGSGMAGLTAAAYLARAGIDVLLIEKNIDCGGLVSCLNVKGFTFDLGAKSIENAGIIKPMLKDLGIELELVKSPVSIGIEKEIIDFDSEDKLNDYQKLLEGLYPESKKDIVKIMDFSKKIFKDMEVLYGIDNPYFKDFINDKAFMIKLLPWLFKFFMTSARINKLKEPVESFLKKMSNNKSLVDIITQHFFKSTPTFFALGYFYVYMDYLYPKGGTMELAKIIEKKIISEGGKILKNTKIIEVDAYSKKLLDSKGNYYDYDELIWAADLKTLYSIVNVSKLNKNDAFKISKQKEKLFSKRGGDSVFTLMLGVNSPVEKFRKISNPHFFYTPKKKGLGENRFSKIKELVNNFGSVSKKDIFKWLDDYLKLNTYEISIPAIRDASLAPKGKTGLIISFLFDYDLIKKVFDAGWYQEFIEGVKERVIKIFEGSIYPGLSEKVLFSYYSTPINISKIAGTSEGGITGWSFEDSSPVVNNLMKMPDSIKTPIPNVLQAGQWAYSPAGIPTCILTGWIAAQEIIKKNN
ncbi:MAG: FAD-dependent oxidoreductase [Candidatus Nanoarchaeia archaeon]|nr:FAD-dependent oxidoreductase [Candidatus Nanoarchaeia archaeon]